MTEKFPYQLTHWLKEYPTTYLKTFKKYNAMDKCLVKEKRRKYSIFTTGELLLPYEGKGERIV